MNSPNLELISLREGWCVLNIVMNVRENEPSIADEN